MPPTAVGPAISLDLDVDDVEMENYEVSGTFCIACIILLVAVAPHRSLYYSLSADSRPAVDVDICTSEGSSTFQQADVTGLCSFAFAGIAESGGEVGRSETTWTYKGRHRTTSVLQIQHRESPV